MFKQQLMIAVMVCAAMGAVAQPVKPVKYKDLVFSDVTQTKNLTYAPDSIKNKKAYAFDLFQPTGDKSTARPLIIWMHGGGFKFGSKDAKGVQLWSKTFAQRGYVCADINYRLSKKNPLFHFDVLLKSCYDAVQDAKLAVAYFKQHAKEYNIDPDKIVLAGNSAGGMIALQAAFSTDAQLAKMAGIDEPYESASRPEKFKVAGVINFWGAIFNLDWLKNQRTPIVSAYGSKDGLVPPTHKNAPLYGSIDVHTKADELQIPNKIKVFDGYSHELQKHFNPFFSGGKGTQQRWLQAGQFAADFLYKVLYK
jgi:poly(3-hydroxybutyrate) depolymerase